MITLALLALLQAGPAAVASGAAEEEITVMGRRLAALSVILGRDARGKLACNLSASSGDNSVDAQLCKTAAACFKQGAVAAEPMRGCIEARKPTILEDFAARVRARAAAL